MKKDTKKVFHDGEFYFIKNVTQAELDILKKLNDCGILTEEPFSYELTTLKKPEDRFAPMAFFWAGINLMHKLKDVEQSMKADIYSYLAEMIGQIHSLGIEHGNLTFKNIHWRDQKLVFGDFALADMKCVDWLSAENIMDSFIRDYSSIMYRAKIRYDDKEFWIKFFEQIIRRYPISEQVRQELITLIKKELELYFDEEKNEKRYYGFL